MRRRWLLALGLALIVLNDHTPDKIRREVYCLVVDVAWDGHKVKAGRLPAYGSEVPNVSYLPGYEPKRSRVFPLSPSPLVYLERLHSIENFSQPNLPLGAGKLTVTVRLDLSPRFPAAKYPELATTAEQAARQIRFVEPIVGNVIEDAIQMEWHVLHVGTLAPGSPVSYSFELGSFVEPVAQAIPERAIVIEHGENYMELSITRPANQAWTFDWDEPPEPGKTKWGGEWEWK